MFFLDQELIPYRYSSSSCCCCCCCWATLFKKAYNNVRPPLAVACSSVRGLSATPPNASIVIGSLYPLQLLIHIVHTQNFIHHEVWQEQQQQQHV